MKRYKRTRDNADFPGMVEDTLGPWVKYEDAQQFISDSTTALASMTERAEAHTLHIAELVTEKTRLREGWNKMTGYSIALQRLIEAHCHGYELPEHALADAPHHAAMLKAGCSYAVTTADALRGILNRYVGLVNSGDAGNWNPETEPEVIAARAALSKNTTAEAK